MKLISQKHSKYKGKEYHKFWIVIPQKLIEMLNWEKGDSLKAEVRDGKLMVEKKS